MGLKLASRLIHVSVVVSTTSSREMPSMPTLYWMPKNGIQATFLVELEVRRQRVICVEAEHRDERQAPTR